MNDAGNALLSVRAEARQLVVPDYAVVDGLIEHTAGSKAEAVRLAASSVDRLTTDLAALGGVPFEESAQRRPLTWSAHSSATREERYHDKETGRPERTGQVTATVALRVTVRDLDMLDAVGGVLAAHQSLNVHAVTYRQMTASAASRSGRYGAGWPGRWARSWHAWRTGTPARLAAARM